MRLSAWEEERLLIFSAAELARRHREHGLLLNAPETIALIADAMLEAAREGASFAGVEAAGRAAVRPSEVLPGVASLVDEVRTEVLLGHPVRRGAPRSDGSARASSAGRSEHLAAGDPRFVALPFPPGEPAARVRPDRSGRVPAGPAGRQL
jgi:urease subunit gamma/beta